MDWGNWDAGCGAGSGSAKAHPPARAGERPGGASGLPAPVRCPPPTPRLRAPEISWDRPRCDVQPCLEG